MKAIRHAMFCLEWLSSAALMSEPDAKKRYYHSGPEGDNKIISKDTIVLSVSRTF